MPIGAENIGTAYVRVIADGKDFDLNEMFDKGFDADRAARRTSRSYQSALNDEFKGPSWVKLEGALTRNLVKMDSAKKFIDSPAWQNFRKSLVKDHHDLGRVAGDALAQEILAGLPLDQIEDRIESFQRDFARANDTLIKANHKNEREELRKHLDMVAAYRENDIRNQRRLAEQAAALRMDRERDEREYADLMAEAMWMNRDLDKKRIFAAKNLTQANNELLKTYREVRADIDMMTKGEIRHGISVRATAGKLDQLRTSLRSAGLATKQIERDIDRHHDALLRMHPTLNRWRHSMTSIADVTGVAFGRGSRNNFLNFVGSMARNSVLLGTGLLNLAGYVGGLGRRMGAANGVLGAFGVLAKDAAKGVGILGGGLVGLFGIIGPLLSILSGLGGIVLALASSMGGALLGNIATLSSTLAFGLAGSAAVAGAALVPLVSGLGVLALGLKNLDGPARASLNHIKSSFEDLGVAAAEGLNFDRTQYQDSHNHAVSSFQVVLKRVNEMVKDLRPLTVEIGRAMADALDILTLRLTGASGAWTLFIKAMSGTDGSLGPLAVQARLTGRIIGEAFGGLLGLLRAIEPQTTNFLQWVRDLARDFNDFANSVRGQNSLRDFFARAANSAAVLGGFLSAVRSLLGEVFEQANAPGDNLFRSMTRGINNWTDALDANPDIMAGWIRSMESFGDFVGSSVDLLHELLAAGNDVGNGLFDSLSSTIDGFVRKIRANPDIMKNFYDSAASFGRALGDVVIGLGKVFSALDNTFSRSFLVGIFETLATVIEGIAGALEGIASLFGEGADGVQKFAGQVAAAAFVLPIFSKALGVTALTGFITNLRTAETRMTALSGAARLAAGAGGLAAFAAGAKSSNDTAGFLMQTLGGAGVGFALGGPWGALIGGGAGAAMALFADRTEDAGDAADVVRPKFLNLASSLDQITGASNRATRELILQEAAASGALSQAKAFGISARDLVSASLGSEDALKRVNAALANNEALTITYADGMGAVVSMQVNSKKQLDEVTASLQAQGLEILGVENAAIDLAASNGVKQFVGDSIDAWRSSTKEVRENYLATQDLSALIGKIPKKAYTDIEARGVAPTIQGVAKVAAKYDLLPKQVRSLLSVLGVDLSVADIRRLQGKLDALEREKNTPKVDLDPSAANSKVRTMTNDLANLHRITSTPKVTVDAAAANATLAGVKARMDAITSKTITITAHHVSTGKMDYRAAAGAIFSGGQRVFLGESGPEAVVPLSRNLNQVDPSVRWLSAIAQGKAMPMASGGVVGAPGRTVSADGWTIVSNSKDPEAVANEVLNRLVGAGY